MYLSHKSMLFFERLFLASSFLVLAYQCKRQIFNVTVSSVLWCNNNCFIFITLWTIKRTMDGRLYFFDNDHTVGKLNLNHVPYRF